MPALTDLAQHHSGDVQKADYGGAPKIEDNHQERRRASVGSKKLGPMIVDLV